MKTCTLWCVVMLVSLIGISTSVDGQDSPELLGEIALIGEDNNVYLLSLEDANLTPITNDATLRRVYRLPTWSLDGDLAYFAETYANNTNAPHELDVYMRSNQTAEVKQIYTQMDEAILTAAWSPRHCELDEACNILAFGVSLIESGQFALRLAGETLIAGSVSNDSGWPSPIYHTWSPDGTRLVVHYSESALATFDIVAALEERLPYTPGHFRTPAWSPVDDRLLFGARNREDAAQTDLFILAYSELRALQAGLAGNVAFGWSPNGDFVAYLAEGDDGTYDLIVRDAVTGEQVASAPDTDVLAFFWAPDSHAIAYLVRVDDPGPFAARNAPQHTRGDGNRLASNNTALEWRLIELDSGNVHRYTNFVPTEPMWLLIESFDQFGASHRLWSPDSTYLVFSEVNGEGQAVISVLDMTRSDTVPFLIGEGSLAIWSFHNR